MKKNKIVKSNENRSFIYAVSLVFVLVFISIVIVFPLDLVEMKKLSVTYTITNKSGFDLNSSALTYGNLMPGTKGTRTVNIGNSFEFPIYISFQVPMELRELLQFNKTIQRVESGGNLSIPFTLNIPSDAIYGDYSSFIVVKIRK